MQGIPYMAPMWDWSLPHNQVGAHAPAAGLLLQAGFVASRRQGWNMLHVETLRGWTVLTFQLDPTCSLVYLI
jgi:hypothetical protein